MRFRLPGSKLDIEAESRVAWSDRRLGMGLQFERVEPSDQQAVDEFVDQHFFTNRKRTLARYRVRYAVDASPIASRNPRPARYSRAARSAFAITMSDAPMSATTAIHSVATPATASTRNARLQREREGDVRADVADRGAAEPQRVRNLQELVGHQRDVCGLERRVAAGRRPSRCRRRRRPARARR